MEHALELLAIYATMPHAWLTVFVPAALAAFALVRFRASWISPAALLAGALGTVATALTTRWTETDTTLGLHLQPAAMLFLLVLWRRRLVGVASENGK